MALPKALDSILNNPMVKAALFKQLVKVMKDNNVELITLSLDNEGKMKVEAYQEEMKVLPKKDFSVILEDALRHTNKQINNAHE